MNQRVKKGTGAETMTATDTELEQQACPWQKRVADLCTAARAPLAVALVWLGIARGKDGVQLALLLLLAAVTLDTLDGYFARLSQSPYQTWLGGHDLAFDVLFSAALLLYLSLAGYLSPVVAALYTVVWIVIFWTQSALYVPAVLFQAPIYAGTILAAVFHDVSVIVWLALWLGLMLVFAGKRFFYVRLPGFFEDLLKGTSNDKPGVGRGPHDRNQMQE